MNDQSRTGSSNDQFEALNTIDGALTKRVEELETLRRCSRN
jgi:hypothetical protein